MKLWAKGLLLVVASAMLMACDNNTPMMKAVNKTKNAQTHSSRELATVVIPGAVITSE